MLQTENRLSRLQWAFTLFGLFLHVGDIFTDTMLALKYIKDAHYCWGVLTILFLLTGMLVTQIFSCAWFWDDINSEEEQGKDSLKGRYAVMHVLGMGIFIRYVMVYVYLSRLLLLNQK